MGDTLKSPYEIRAELLSMSIAILESQSSRRMQNECLRPEELRKPVGHFTVEDVLDTASKLNGFVSRG